MAPIGSKINQCHFEALRLFGNIFQGIIIQRQIFKAWLRGEAKNNQCHGTVALVRMAPLKIKYKLNPLRMYFDAIEIQLVQNNKFLKLLACLKIHMIETFLGTFFKVIYCRCCCSCSWCTFKRARGIQIGHPEGLKPD